MVLNIGGVCFSTSRDTLCASNSFFNCLQGRHIFVDRDATHFRYILNFLRGGVVLPINRVTLHELRVEADFYCLPELVNMIDHTLDMASTGRDDATMGDVVAGLREVTQALRDAA